MWFVCKRNDKRNETALYRIQEIRVHSLMQVCEHDRLVKSFNEDIKYFEDYKKRLCQFIINNCCYMVAYSSNKNIRKHDNRIHITHNEMTGLLKEIQNIEISIYNLKLNRNQI